MVVQNVVADVRHNQATAEKLVKLAAIRDKRGAALYDAVKLAVEIYADKAWIASVGGPDQAEGILEDEYLGDVCQGGSTFQRLSRLIAAVPEREKWRELKYNVPALYAEMLRRQPDEPKESRSRRAVSIKEHEEVCERLKDAVCRLDRTEDAMREVREENARLRAELALKDGRIQELERQVNVFIGQRK